MEYLSTRQDGFTFYSTYLPETPYFIFLTIKQYLSVFIDKGKQRISKEMEEETIYNFPFLWTTVVSFTSFLQYLQLFNCYHCYVAQ